MELSPINKIPLILMTLTKYKDGVNSPDIRSPEHHMDSDTDSFSVSYLFSPTTNMIMSNTHSFR